MVADVVSHTELMLKFKSVQNQTLLDCKVSKKYQLILLCLYILTRQEIADDTGEDHEVDLEDGVSVVCPLAGHHNMGRRCRAGAAGSPV